jgi:hypothetical protein
MRYTLAIACLAAGLGLAAGLLIGWRTADRPPTPTPEPDAKQTAEQNTAPKVGAPVGSQAKSDGGPKAKGIEMKLNTIYTTTDQPELKRFPDPYDDHSRRALHEVQTQVMIGVSNAFLVTGFDIYDALSTTWAVMDHLSAQSGQTVRPVFMPKPPQDHHPKTVWLFVGFEPSEYPRAWDLTRVSIDGPEIVVRYKAADPPRRNAFVLYPQAYWMPLPIQDAGEYVIRLHDEGEKADTLVRRVRIVVE